MLDSATYWVGMHELARPGIDVNGATFNERHAMTTLSCSS